MVEKIILIKNEQFFDTNEKHHILSETLEKKLPRNLINRDKTWELTKTSKNPSDSNHIIFISSSQSTMNSITPTIQKKFDELWYDSNLKSIDGIWKRMNKDGFKISNYQVRHLVHEKRRAHIVDRDEESEDDDDDDEYTDDEEEEQVKGKVNGGGPNVPIPTRLSVFLNPPSVPQAYDPSRDPQFMFGVSLMKGYCLDDDGNR